MTDMLPLTSQGKNERYSIQVPASAAVLALLFTCRKQMHSSSICLHGPFANKL